jgi:hypothetical protein
MRRAFDIRLSTFRDGVTPRARVAINRSGDPSLKCAVMRVPTLHQFDFERSGRRAGAFSLDHDDFGLNQSKIMNVIDSNNLERDAGGKPVPTFPHPALEGREGRRPQGSSRGSSHDED